MRRAFDSHAPLFSSLAPLRRARRCPALPPRPRRGFTIIGLVLVLLIIFILFYNQTKPGTTGLTPQQVQLEKTRESACLANRAVFRTNMTVWAASHPGQAVTIDAMRATGSVIPECPDGGTYSVLQDGSLHCTLHSERFQQIHSPGSVVQPPGTAPAVPGQAGVQPGGLPGANIPVVRPGADYQQALQAQQAAQQQQQNPQQYAPGGMHGLGGARNAAAAANERNQQAPR